MASLYILEYRELSEYLICFQADVDNSGSIDYGEFVAATIHLNKLEREEHLMAAFQYFDKDSSGYITVDELQQACAEHNMTDVYLEDIIKEVDQDNVSEKYLMKLDYFFEVYYSLWYAVPLCVALFINLLPPTQYDNYFYDIGGYSNLSLPATEPFMLRLVGEIWVE